MISVEAFFSATLGTVDTVIGNYVEIAYSHFIAANTEMITLLFTFYVMYLGYQFITHTQQCNLSTITKRLIVMLSVYGLVMDWKLYNMFVYRIFTTEPGNIAQILVAASTKSGSVESVAKALDGIFSAVLDTSSGFFGQIGLSQTGISMVFYGLLVFVVGVLLCSFALLLFIYAKMMMAVALGLGPIFILFILWEPTKGLFSAWLNKLITIALIPIVTSAILMLMLSVINVTLPSIQQPSNAIQFYGIAPFLGLSLTTTLVLSQVFRICSSLGGGITLASVSQGMNIAQAALQKSGFTAAGRATANWSQNRVRQIKKRLTRGDNS